MQFHSAIEASDLLALYRRAYISGSCQDRNDFVKLLFNEPVVFDRRFIELWRATAYGQSVKMLSNGSITGVRGVYQFGPPLAIRDIEKAQKSPDGDCIYMVGTIYADKAMFAVKDGAYRFVYGNDDFTPLAKWLTRTRGYLMARPFVWLYLLSRRAFTDMLASNKDNILSIVSTDWGPFFNQTDLIKEGIFVNDCMIDWKTGLNFHQCRSGQYHSIPMFVNDGGYTYNWLNLCDKTAYATADVLQIHNNGFVKCKCGRGRLNVNVVPRHRDLVDASILRKLGSSYRSLQFIVDKGTTKIFYSTEGPFIDRPVLESLFDKPEFYAGKIAVTGFGKWPSFWDTAQGPFMVHSFDL